MCGAGETEKGISPFSIPFPSTDGPGPSCAEPHLGFSRELEKLGTKALVLYLKVRTALAISSD